jgi:hypothetical protein
MVTERKPTTRSKLTNGSKLLVDCDGRSAWARRFKDLFAAFISDAGGDDAVSEGKRSILRRAAIIATELERIESVFAINGRADAGDLDLYAKTSAVLSRLLEKAGLDRAVRDVTPTITEFLAEHAREKAAHARAAPDAATAAAEPANAPTATAGEPVGSGNNLTVTGRNSKNATAVAYATPVQHVGGDLRPPSGALPPPPLPMPPTVNG